jgi:hypothetical protein
MVTSLEGVVANVGVADMKIGHNLGMNACSEEDA